MKNLIRVLICLATIFFGYAGTRFLICSCWPVATTITDKIILVMIAIIFITKCIGVFLDKILQILGENVLDEIADTIVDEIDREEE